MSIPEQVESGVKSAATYIGHHTLIHEPWCIRDVFQASIEIYKNSGIKTSKSCKGSRKTQKDLESRRQAVQLSKVNC